MKKILVILVISSVCILYSCLVQTTSRQTLDNLQQQPDQTERPDSIITFSAYQQPAGNADSGYAYLLHGNMFNTGISYPLYNFFFKTVTRKVMSLAGFNQHVLSNFTVFEKGQKIATPGCLGCHGEWFDGKFIIGLGNSYSKFDVNYASYLKPFQYLMKMIYGRNSQEWKNFEELSAAGSLVAPRIVLETQGPNPEHHLVQLMASHRDPVTFLFRSDTSYFDVPPVAVPTDIPALWLARKKIAWTYNGSAQGNAVKNLMLLTIMTLHDTTEAATIFSRMKDVWAYLQTLEPPRYPFPVNAELAQKGERLFNTNCSGCHGTYGRDGHYPSELIPEDMIGTDSLLLKYYTLYQGYENWYNKSWFARAYEPAFTKAGYGYIAQPLDGVWITAPYFHNGSVPTIEAVLDSKIRPRYWKRNFNREKYDYRKLGWKHTALRKPGGKKTYNTDIPGYGNYGHYFGDKLTNAERTAVIEYLKTL